MRALILAAGRGTRLRSVHDRPKCLLPVGGVALLDRYIRALDALGIETVVVAGYRADDVRARLEALAPRTPVSVVVNADYERGSILSLACGLETMDDALLLLDGDVIFHPALLARLATSPQENALLVDIGSTFTGEEYMAGVDAGRVTQLRRGPVEGHDAAGEWVGFCRLDRRSVTLFREAVRRQIAAGDTAGGYEDALAATLPLIDMRCEDASDLPWVEIDFPGDAERAEALVRDGLL